MLNLKWTLSAVFAMSFVAAAPKAQAQQSRLATFTLPAQADFGGVTLPPGEYTISRVTATGIVRVAGEGGMATILAASIDSQAEVGSSKIILESVNGVLALKRFDSGILGTRFDFEVAKMVGRNHERAGVAPRSTVEIAAQ